MRSECRFLAPAAAILLIAMNAADPAAATGSAPPGAETAGAGAPPVAYVPLYADGTATTEDIQYTEPDGTLVTLAGFRPTNRHARERGEPWYLPGSQVFNPVDVGPGNYFTFPTFYFQNRTYGLMVRDEVPAGRSRVTFYLRVSNGTFINNGISLFRRVDPNVGEYGWMNNQGFTNVVENNRRCHSTSAPTDCRMDGPVLDNWRAPQPGTPLQVGDKIEVAPAQFLDNTDGAHALIDGGGIRYYSFEQLYVVGRGMVPWYGIAPLLDSEPLPDSALLGGQASVSYNYSDESMRNFQQTVNNIGFTNMQRFVEGRRLFHTSFADGRHSESPNVNPVFTAHIGQLGPRFNADRCLGCHQLNGRSLPPRVGEALDTISVFTAAASSAGGTTPDPTYGMNVQQRASAPDAADYTVELASHTTQIRTLADGTPIELRQPIYHFNGPTPAQFSVRQASQVIGMGLLEAVDEATILAWADPDDADSDGVRGVPNWVTDPQTGDTRLGRFGWKAGKASLRHQVASALMLDLGVTSPIYRSRACQLDPASTACTSATQTTPGVNEEELLRLAQYLELLGVPAQRNLRSGYAPGQRVPAEHDVDPVRIANGAAVFEQTRCGACHRPQMTTGTNHPMAELRGQAIRPYTDLLLHDMGDGLADTLAEGQATARMWRTPPLWGLGSLPYTQRSASQINAPDPTRLFASGFEIGELRRDPVSNARYLHDGRARTLTEAILWHDGEAQGSRLLFEQLSAQDRDDLLDFLKSL
ncbi:MAG: thiol oxidoreductase [Rhodanobacter denitrificans]|uniref:Thiol oxidoreductase n=1 Tax=Rhodanobacter denitrificans TaxID=666685 RepID=A0A2W5K6H4_9GAMM|nr:MAG: thiol oxidoreductase [Rhodanobacter denitrificans]